MKTEERISGIGDMTRETGMIEGRGKFGHDAISEKRIGASVHFFEP